MRLTIVLGENGIPNGDYNLLVMPNESNIFKYMGEDYKSWRDKTIKYYEGQVSLMIREKIGKRKQRWQEIIHDEESKESNYI